MTEREKEAWEQGYWDAVDRDFARKIYEQCDKEDEAAREKGQSDAERR